jgi:hypothetical protein
MKRQLGMLISALIASSACASRAPSTVRYPPPEPHAPAAASLGGATGSSLVAMPLAAPNWPGWCVPPSFSPFGVLVGMKACGEGGGDSSGDASEATLVPLPVIGFDSAVVAVPHGVTRPKPVVLAMHASADRPEWACERMHAFTGDRAFVLCPRGTLRGDSKPDDPRYVWAGDPSAEVDAAIASLRLVYGPLVDSGAMMYEGFSQGAIVAPGVVMRDPSRFTRMLLIEGGTSGWDAHKYAAGGGERVLWACGQAGCAASATVLAARFMKENVPSRVAYAPGAGHTDGGAVHDAIRNDWDWLIADDPRWAP